MFRSWWPLYRYVLARLTLCISKLLSIPPAEFLYELARVDPRSNSTIEEQPSVTFEGEDMMQLPSAHTPASGAHTTASSTTGAHSDAESCHIALKASFELLNIFAMREDLEDSDGLRRKQLHQFVTMLLPRLKRSEQPPGEGGWSFYVDLHAVLVLTVFNPELHQESKASSSDVSVEALHSQLHEDHFHIDKVETTSTAAMLIGRVCFQHRLGADVSVLTSAEIVTNSGRKASCFLKLSGDSLEETADGGGSQGHTESASITLPHSAMCYCDVFMDREAVKRISGSKLHCVHLSWAQCPLVCFRLATVCSSKSKPSWCFGGTVVPTSPKATSFASGGCWPPPLRQAFILHKLCVPPPPPLGDDNCPGLVEPLLPSLSLSKVCSEISDG